tara:strand:+ start:1018 stop:2547 length:1530 start_codon:yes stop_codon:yes gene_type:complete
MLDLHFNNNVLDASGNSFSAELQDTFFGMDRFGNCDYALGFDSYLQLANIKEASFNDLVDFTVSTWVKHESTVFGTFLSIANSSRDNEFNLNIDQNGRISSNIRNQANVPGIAIVGTRDINDGEWHHVILTRNGSTGEAAIYTDGVLNTTKVMPLGKIEVGLNGFILGNDQDCLSGCYSQNQQFIGRLDDLRVYDRVVNAQEINALFNLVDGEVSDSERGSLIDIETCETSVTLEVERDFDTFSWNTGSQSRSLVVNSSGQYIVSGFLKDCEYKDTINVTFNVLPQIVISSLSTDLVCDEEIILQASTGFDEYEWQDGSSGMSFNATEPGIYSVKGRTFCGESQSSEIEITKKELETLVVNSDALEIGCQEVLTLTATDGYTDYKWSNGEVGQSIAISTDGEYRLEAINQCGEIKNAVINIRDKVLNINSLPNAFTPNGDGKNEVFEVDASFRGSKLMVFNRWGNIVFVSDNYQNEWNGDGLIDGTYYFQFTGGCLENRTVRNWVRIFR